MLRFAVLETDQGLVEQARDLAQRLLHDDSAASAAIVSAHLARWLGLREDFLRV
jgi:ATP-dependent DNA helicase RecG